MDDLISRQMAINALRKCSVKEVTPAYMLIDKAEAMTELMMLSSPQPEIIRCKDCKFYMTIGCICDGCCISDDWYCASAERRDDE